MQPLICGRYRAEFGRSPSLIKASLALRAQVFRAGNSDRDEFDAYYDHITVTDVSNGQVMACARAIIFKDGVNIDHSYVAQRYDITKFATLRGPLMELGRFCARSEDRAEPDILRAMWAALTRMVDEYGVRFLFGCASFCGADPADKIPALAYLARNHLAPADLMPGVKMAGAVALTELDATSATDAAGRGAIPPLLRSYLSMGAWVSDHAVIDEDLDTLYVVAGLEINAIPESRKKRLRALAGVDVGGQGA